MGTVEHPINDNDEDDHDKAHDHLARVVCRRELCSNIRLIALHLRVEDEDVGCYYDLDGGNEHIKVVTRLLLLDLREQSAHEGIVVSQPLEPLHDCESLLTTHSVLVADVVLRFAFLYLFVRHGSVIDHDHRVVLVILLHQSP